MQLPDSKQAYISRIQEEISQKEHMSRQIMQQQKNTQQSKKNQVAATPQRLKVALRVRPTIPSDIGKEVVAQSCSTEPGKQADQISITTLTHHHSSSFDRVFEEEASQDDVYSYISDSIDNVVSGFNCTIFAYGQTGSGKTYTMFGKGFDDMLRKQARQANPVVNKFIKKQQERGQATIDRISDINLMQDRGIIPRCITDLFLKIKDEGL